MRTARFLAGAFALQVLFGGCKKEEPAPPEPEEEPAPAPPAPTPPVAPTTPPTAEFSFRGPFVAGDSVRFVNSSSNATKYRWFFGDGNTSTATSPIHVYRQAGRFTIQLQAINALDTARYTSNVDITLRPPAGYTCDCMVTTQTWTNSQGATGPIVRQVYEKVIIGAFTDVRVGVGFRFKNYDYAEDVILNTSTYRFYHSTLYSLRAGGIARFYPATDSIITEVKSDGTQLGGVLTVYRCKKR